MVRIISDTSTMYSSQQAKAAGFAVAPLAVTIDNKTYLELDEIDSDSFVDIIRQGHIPVSSQPSPGDVIRILEDCGNDDVLGITIADGLSGTYSSAVTAASCVEKAGSIEILDSGTLCGPQRYLVETAVKLAKAGATLPQIKEKLLSLMKTDISFLIPHDFDFLRRGGRVSSFVSLVGKTIHLVPVMTQSKDRRSLVKSAVCRSFRLAVRHIADEMKKWGVESGWRIYISHGAAQDLADAAKAQIIDVFQNISIEVLPLTPVFITQGGPRCVAIQAVKLLPDEA